MPSRDFHQVSVNSSKDPSGTIDEFNRKLVQLESSGGTITQLQMVQYLHDGLSGDSLRDNFWFHCRGQMNMSKLENYTFESACEYICKFWYAYRTKRVYESANKASTYEPRLCELCRTAKRFRIMKSHNTENCRIKQKETLLKKELVKN